MLFFFSSFLAYGETACRLHFHHFYSNKIYSLLHCYFITTSKKEIGRFPGYHHIKSFFACTDTSCAVTTSTLIINKLDCTESEFGLKTMLCICFACPCLQNRDMGSVGGTLFTKSEQSQGPILVPSLWETIWSY